MDNVIKFKEKFVDMFVVCNDCEITWTMTVNKRIYNKMIREDSKTICKYCYSHITEIYYKEE